MSAMPGTPEPTRRPGFLREGFSDLKRKFQRRKLRSQLRRQEAERNQALVRLGQQAWEKKIDLSAFAGQRDRLTSLDSKSRELADTSTRLQAERLKLEQKRQDEVTAFDNRRRPLEEKKQKLEGELRAAGQRLAGEQQTVKQAESRLGELASQRTALEQKTAAASTTPAAQSPPAPSREELLAEQAKLSEALETSRFALQSRSTEVNQLAAQVRQCAEDISAVEAQKKEAVAPLDAALERLRGQLSAAAQETTGVEKERREQFHQLGAALYDSRTQAPDVGREVQQIASIDQARAATNASLEASLSLSRAVPRATLLKFWAVVILVPAMMFKGGYWLFSAVNSSGAAGKRPRYEMPAIRESEKNAIVATFVESRTSRKAISDEKTRAAIHVLTEDLMELGSTVNPRYLPLLVRILHSDAPELSAAAADAIGMIGPTADQTAPLTETLNDPVPAVRQSAAQALRESADPSARDLFTRTQRSADSYAADPIPGEKELGVPVYPGAKFLYFASNLRAGRAVFVTSDPTASVLSFYSGKTQGTAVTLEEAAQWPQEAREAKVHEEFLTETRSRGIADYNNQRLYGNPMIVVLRETDSGGVKLPTHFAVVFEDRALKQTGFVLHFVPQQSVTLPPREAGDAIEQ